MTTITGLHHVAIRSLDFDRTLRFYTETLGLKRKAAWITNGRRATLLEFAPATYLEIFERSKEEFSGEPPILHFCVRTDDVDALFARVKTDGWETKVDPKTVPVETDIGLMTLRLAFVAGPDGEIIELMQSDIV